MSVFHAQTVWMIEMIELLLSNSGCFRLWIGAESGSQKVLDLMARGVKVDLRTGNHKKEQKRQVLKPVLS